MSSTVNIHGRGISSIAPNHRRHEPLVGGSSEEVSRSISHRCKAHMLAPLHEMNYDLEITCV